MSNFMWPTSLTKIRSYLLLLVELISPSAMFPTFIMSMMVSPSHPNSNQ